METDQLLDGEPSSLCLATCYSLNLFVHRTFFSFNIKCTNCPWHPVSGARVLRKERFLWPQRPPGSPLQMEESLDSLWETLTYTADASESSLSMVVAHFYFPFLSIP